MLEVLPQMGKHFPMATALGIALTLGTVAKAQDYAALEAALDACTLFDMEAPQRIEKLSAAGWSNAADTPQLRERLAILSLARFPQAITTGGDKFVKSYQETASTPLEFLSEDAGEAPSWAGHDAKLDKYKALGFFLDHAGLAASMTIDVRLGKDGKSLEDIRCKLMVAPLVEAAAFTSRIPPDARSVKERGPDGSPGQTLTFVEAKGVNGNQRYELAVNYIDLSDALGLRAIQAAAGSTVSLNTIATTHLEFVPTR